MLLLLLLIPVLAAQETLLFTGGFNGLEGSR